MRHDHIRAASPTLILPRGLLAVRAAAEPRKIASIDDLNVAWEKFKSHYDDKQAKIQAHLDEQGAALAGIKINGFAGAGGGRPDPAYTATFSDWFKGGRDEEAVRSANFAGERGGIRAAMTSGDNASGGYLAPVEWDRKVSQAQRTRSPMRRLSTVVTTSVGAYTTVWNDGNVGSGWVGETAARPGTTTPGLATIGFAAGELYANPAVSQQLLDDADFPLEDWLAGVLADEFDKQEGIAFLSGNGTNKPRGFLGYVTGGASAGVHPGGNLDVVASGNASTLGSNLDVLTTFKYGLAAPYRQNAVWLMNSQTGATLALFKDAGGNALWQPDRSATEPATFMGRPVEFDEGMPNIGAGNTPIAFGDFKAGYVINDRSGVLVLRDPYTNKPFVNFYTRKRTAGGVADPRAIRLLKIAVS